MREPEQRKERYNCDNCNATGTHCTVVVRANLVAWILILIIIITCRACIRPEVSRTKTIGKTGVSVGMFFKNHLQYIQLNSNPIDFTKRNMSYLLKASLLQGFH